MKKRGFSLSEVLIAVAVIAIGLLGTLASLVYGVRGQAVAGAHTQATNYARQLIELVRVRNLAWPPGTAPPTGGGVNDSPSSNPLALDAAPFTTDFAGYRGANNDGRPFFRKIQLRRVSNTVTDPNYRVMEVKVTVYWYDRTMRKSVTLTGHDVEP